MAASQERLETSRATHKALYQQRKANRQCVRCGVPFTVGTVCEWCKVKVKRSNKRYRKSKNGKDNKRSNHKKYQSSAKGRERLRQYREDKKIRGECIDCSEPALDDSNYCLKHRDARRLSDKKSKQRKYMAVENRFPGNTPTSQT